jgi:hypothetical protein
VEAGLADGAGVAADDELARLDAGDGVADPVDDPAVLVPDGAGLVDLVDAAIGPQVGSADEAATVRTMASVGSRIVGSDRSS